MQKYTASVITAGCLWGLMGLFTRTLATYGVDSTGAIVLRCGIAALLFAVTLFVRDPKQFRIRLKDIWCFIGAGICSLLFFTYCYFQAITIMDLSTAAVLLYTAPSIVMILSLILFHERITVQKLIALVLAFAGCCLVSLVGGEHKLSTVGILYGLGAGFGYALYSIFARYALDRGYSSNTINFYSCLLTTIGAAIGLLRQTVYYDRYVKTAYAGSPLQYHFGRTTHQLYGSKWGIVGLGNIGRSVARVAEALGCRIAYTSTSGVVREEPYPEKPLDELLRWADVVSVHAPLNDRTRNLIGARELALMKPSAILINVARGGIVDEAALAAALDAGRLAGAGLDVFTHEPLEAGNPLLSVREPDRLLLSPHNAWSPVEAIEILVECIARNIRDFYTPQNQ